MLTVQATGASGQPASAGELATAAGIIRQRLAADGIAGQVTATVPGILTVTVPDLGSPGAYSWVFQPGQLTFRKVIDETDPGAAPATPKLGNATTPAVPAALRTKLGPAADAADRLVHGTLDPSDPAQVLILDPFRLLTADEVAELPVEYQFDIPQINCRVLSDRALAATATVTEPIVVCQENAKLFLDVAKVQGSDLASATAVQPDGSGLTHVRLTFTDAGARRWSALTREAFTNAGNACRYTQPSTTDASRGVCEVAIVEDGMTLAAPGIQAVLDRDAVIDATFSPDDAVRFTAQLNSGELPVSLTVVRSGGR